MSNCTEVISLFKKVGGRIICDYDKKTLVVENTNLSCEIKSEDWARIDSMMFDNGFYSIENIKSNIVYKDDDFIVKLHNYQNYHSKGFIIDTLDK
jgi:hypothetical protein